MPGVGLGVLAAQTRLRFHGREGQELKEVKKDDLKMKYNIANELKSSLRLKASFKSFHFLLFVSSDAASYETAGPRSLPSGSETGLCEPLLLGCAELRRLPEDQRSTAGGRRPCEGKAAKAYGSRLGCQTSKMCVTEDQESMQSNCKKDTESSVP